LGKDLSTLKTPSNHLLPGLIFVGFKCCYISQAASPLHPPYRQNRVVKFVKQRLGDFVATSDLLNLADYSRFGRLYQ
jgi:hypothetical protein